MTEEPISFDSVLKGTADLANGEKPVPAPRFDFRFTLGNVITWTGVVATGCGIYFGLKAAISEVSTAVSGHSQTIVELRRSDADTAIWERELERSRADARQINEKRLTTVEVTLNQVLPSIDSKFKEVDRGQDSMERKLDEVIRLLIRRSTASAPVEPTSAEIPAR